MKLPKLDIPHYKTTLPVCGKEVTYRPYTVKEEEILLMAATSEEGNDEDILMAVIQVIENCCGIEYRKTHPADTEWLFMKLRAASFSNLVNISLITNGACGNDTCPESIDTLANLDNMELFGLDYLTRLGFEKTKDGWKVKITDEVGMIIYPVNEPTDDAILGLYNSIITIWNGEEVTNREDFTLEELREWIGSMPRSVSDRMKLFFGAQPFVYLPIKAKCPSCGKEYNKEITGLIDFFA